MAEIIVFGGSGGLGKAIISRLIMLDHSVVSVTHNLTSTSVNSKQFSHFTLDLSSPVDLRLNELQRKYPQPNAICFAQRYRPDTEVDPITEYRTMVSSVSKIVEFYDERNTGNKCIRIVIIGSIYSERVGLDQGWSYHCVKHAQLGLVRYWSIAKKSNLLFYLISPATYIKDGAEQYWANNPKSEIWSRYPSGRLLSANDISLLVCEVLLNGSPLLSGSNLIADMGVSRLYNDQRS